MYFPRALSFPKYSCYVKRLTSPRLFLPAPTRKIGTLTCSLDRELCGDLVSDDSVPLALPFLRFADSSSEVTALYRELRKPLLRYLVCLGLSSDEAQDVVQDSFVSLQHHLAAGGAQDNIRGWLFRVAHNQARNRQSSYHRRTPPPPPF